MGFILDGGFDHEIEWWRCIGIDCVCVIERG